MLKTLATQSIKRVLASPAGWRMAAPVRRKGVVAMMYHRINQGPAHFPGMPVDQFRDQMRWIRRNCTPVAAEEVLDAARRAGRIRPPLLVTFDDGYRDYHDRAYPILRELGIPAAVFLSTHFMDRGGLLWTERVHWAVAHTRKDSLRPPWAPGRAIPLGDGASRAAAARECNRHLKGIRDAERLRWLEPLIAQLEVAEADTTLGRQMLSWDEVRATREGTHYGGHSHTHPILSQLEPAALEEEIRTCRDRIAAETGVAPRTFAYPNGRPQDFNEATRALLARYGFDIVFSTVEGIIGPDSDPMALTRQHSGGTTVGDFAALVARA